MALKLARYATGRHKTLSMWDSFHGASLDAASVGGEALFRRDVGPLLSGTEHVPPPGLATRFFGDDGRAHERLADYIDDVLEVQGDVGAVIAEPMRWTTVEPPPPGFWPRVRASCDRHGALLVFDEVPSCLGRTGTMFVTEQTGAVPDILVLGKGLGGGIRPMAAIVARGDFGLVPRRPRGIPRHHEEPVGCAAALAALDVIEEDGLLGAARDLGRHALERLGTMAARNCWITKVRGLGLHLGVEIGPAHGDPASDAAAERCSTAVLEAGAELQAWRRQCGYLVPAVDDRSASSIRRSTYSRGPWRAFVERGTVARRYAQHRDREEIAVETREQLEHGSSSKPSRMAASFCPRFMSYIDSLACTNEDISILM